MDENQKLELIEARKSLSGMRTYFSKLEREDIAKYRKIMRLQEEEIQVLHNRLRMAEAFEGKVENKRVRVAYKRKKNPRAYQLHLSDTHSREIVRKEETGGRNEHNPDIGRERLRSVIMQSIEHIKDDSRNHDPVHLTVWGGGDWMVNADLHYKMERCVDVEPLVEMRLTYEMLKEELGILWKEVPVESLSFVGSFSNHGRDSKEMIPGLEAARSYDSEIYRRLEGDFPKVKFHVAETNWTVEEVAGFRTMYTHGHAAKCKVARGPTGVMVPNWGFLAEMKRTYNFNAWVQGHYHSASALVSHHFAHMQNGSLVGENGYSNSGAFPGEPASQNLAVVNLTDQEIEKVIKINA
jgi:hypothetical protein